MVSKQKQRITKIFKILLNATCEVLQQKIIKYKEYDNCLTVVTRKSIDGYDNEEGEIFGDIFAKR